jgi:predicted amidohydrolase
VKEFVAAGAQIAVSPNDPGLNLKKGAEWIRRAVENHGASLVVFPEDATTGFNPALKAGEIWDMVDSIPGRMTEPIQEAARENRAHVVWTTYERGEKRGVVYNSAVMVDPSGEILGIYRKTHPFPTERLGGGGWVTPGNEAILCETALGKIGMIICYDGDFPELSRVLAVNGAEIIVRPSALLRPFDLWHLTNAARAYDNHVYMVAVNAVGADASGTHYFGHSMIVSPIGQRLAQGRGVEEMVFATLNPDPLKFVSFGTDSPQIFDHLEDRNLAAYGDILKKARSPFEPSRRVPY